MSAEISTTAIPTRWVGPIRISGNVVNEEISVPQATYETPLWPSTGRGASISRMVEGGIQVTVHDSRMTRSTLFIARDAAHAAVCEDTIKARFTELQDAVRAQSRFAELIEVHAEIAGNLLFTRFALRTGDASGHNMATAAAEAIINLILSWDLGLEYGSISGNMCIDKKASAINGILGRGHRVTAEILLPHEVVEKRLRATTQQIVDLNTRKNLIGSILAGSLRSGNAHYANMLLAFYLATGQDAANIVEGSQGLTIAENRPEGLYFACYLPNLIMGTVGNGKHLPHVEEAMVRLGCREYRAPGLNSKRLAALCAAQVLCCELSLLGAQTNPGELMRTHKAIERNSNTPGTAAQADENKGE